MRRRIFESEKGRIIRDGNEYKEGEIKPNDRIVIKIKKYAGNNAYNIMSTLNGYR
jgi:hypothetical protein